MEDVATRVEPVDPADPAAGPGRPAGRSGAAGSVDVVSSHPVPVAPGGGGEGYQDPADTDPVGMFLASRRMQSWAVWAELTAIATLWRQWQPDTPVSTPASTAQQTRQARLGRRDLDPVGLHEACVVLELSLAAGISEYLAGQRVDAARALLVDHRLPLTAVLLRTAVLDWARVRILVTRTKDLSDADARAVEAEVFADLAQYLEPTGTDPDTLTRIDLVVAGDLPAAARLSVGRFEHAVERAVLRVDAEAAERRRRAARTGRHVSVFPGSDGTASLWATGPADAITAAYTGLDTAARTLRTAGDPRTLDQLRHDLLVTACTTTGSGLGSPNAAGAHPASGSRATRTTPNAGGAEGAANAGGADDGGDGGGGDQEVCWVPPWFAIGMPQVQANITVTVSLETLLGLTDDPAMLDHYGPVAAQMARDLAARGIWRCLAVDDTHGTVLGVGTSTYTPAYTPGQRLKRFLEQAAPVCGVPYCGIRARRCDLDHRQPHGQGGATCDCNTRPLRLSHESRVA